MVWIRYARIRAVWRCYTTRGYTTKYHAVGVAIKDEYEKKPTDDIYVWARKVGDFVVDKMCENSCHSLSTSVFCDKTSLEVEVIYTSETLVVRPVEKKEVEIVEEEERKELEEELKERPLRTEPPAVPKYILEQINYLEKRFKEAESVDEKLAIRDEINKIKDRYRIT
jgi:hypothetical protein